MIVDEKSKTATVQFLQTLLPEQINRILYNSLDYFMRLLANKVKGKLSGPVLKVQTGRLRSSIITDIIPQPPKLIGKIGTNVVYATIHEYGGIIRAKNKPYLQFKTPTGWVSVKEVHMPERSYLRSSLDEEFPKLPDIIRLQLRKALQVNA